MKSDLVITELAVANESGCELLSKLHYLAFSSQGDVVWSAGDFRAMVEFSGAHCLVAQVEDQPVGFALVRLVCDEAELITIAVDPSVQQRGVGRALLDHLRIFLRDKEVEKLFLEVRSDNIGAVKLYQAAGFEKIGTRPNYYQTQSGNRKDALCFVLIISD